MKIAVASENGLVTEHFGHCKEFNIYDCENDKIKAHSVIKNPGHRPGFLPNFLNDMGVNVVISGGMGSGAIDIFNEKNIKVIVGASGLSNVAVVSYLNGTLVSANSVCNEHMHKGECENQ